ncbi:MAG: type II toxin-antitoxin system RelE/ParE family toxin, partial [archaeon]
MYKLVFDKRALEQLNKLDTLIKKRIWNKLQQCKENPFRFLERLEYISGFKLRVGDYRVIIDVDNKNKVLNILKVGHRKN